MVRIVELMMVSLQQGGSFSFALAKHPDVFPPLYIHTVKAAEASGQLPLVLNRSSSIFRARYANAIQGEIQFIISSHYSCCWFDDDFYFIVLCFASINDDV